MEFGQPFVLLTELPPRGLGVLQITFDDRPGLPVCPERLKDLLRVPLRIDLGHQEGWDDIVLRS